MSTLGEILVARGPNNSKNGIINKLDYRRCEKVERMKLFCCQWESILMTFGCTFAFPADKRTETCCEAWLLKEMESLKSEITVITGK